MREINLNGYIDDEVYFGDEITPAMLQEHLYGTSGGEPNDVHIMLNSYGGNCNAATRMYDMLRSYPADVLLTISGTAASAATVLASAAKTVEMTPGSLYMIHDPSTIAWGNERELMDAVNLLKACKESIVNIYELRTEKTRDELAQMMSDTTWMDAEAALASGFIDKIVGGKGISIPANDASPINAATVHIVNRKDAEAKVAAYFERQHGARARAAQITLQPTPQPTPQDNTKPTPQDTQTPESIDPGVSHAQLSKRLDLIK